MAADQHWNNLGYAVAGDTAGQSDVPQRIVVDGYYKRTAEPVDTVVVAAEPGSTVAVGTELVSTVVAVADKLEREDAAHFEDSVELERTDYSADRTDSEYIAGFAAHMFGPEGTVKCMTAVD